MISPKISIITINYNEPLLERTCESIVSQTFKDYEWIVIDGGSTNSETVATLEKYKKDMMYFVSEPDGGLYDAMNKGIAQANGNWLIFMNGGDCFYDKESLQSMVPYIDQNASCAVIYGGILFEYKKNPEPYFIKQGLLDDLFFYDNNIPHPSSFIRRDMFVKYGKYREDLRIVSDWARFAQMYWAGEKFKSVDLVVAKYNVDGISSTINRSDVFMERAKVLRECQPWIFNEELLKTRECFYNVLQILFFVGKWNRYFKRKRNTYRALLKYIKIYSEKFIKDKVLFIDNSYHKKTHSTDFLLDLMRKYFDCDVDYDDSWEDGKKLDISKYDFTKYKHVLFFQVLPRWRDLRKIRHKSMFWFPMEDVGIMREGSLRRRCRKLKTINFTQIGHKRCAELGGASLPVRFFIKPEEFVPGDKSKVFFWQRKNHINIRNVIKVLPEDKELHIHLHRAVDPLDSLVVPRADVKEKYNITYSDWFENKSEMADLMKQAGIYIAPRQMEGIGMSFLEAMAMGKAVIAQDAPTMNEYIENGINGYLVDFDKPEPIDLSDIEWIQKNAYEDARFGYIRWQNDKIKIIKFIKGELN